MTSSFRLTFVAFTVALLAPAAWAQGAGPKMTEPAAAPAVAPAAKPMARRMVHHRRHVAKRAVVAKPAADLSRPNQSSLSRAAVNSQVRAARKSGTMTPAGEAPLPAGERPVK